MSESSPAFRFYANDFLSGSAAMSLTERGAYITLLAHQWTAGSVPDGLTAISHVLGCSVGQAAKLWRAVGVKFQQNTDGTWRNPRLEKERYKQAVHREVQRANGQLGGRPRHPGNGNP